MFVLKGFHPINPPFHVKKPFINPIDFLQVLHRAIFVKIKSDEAGYSTTTDHLPKRGKST